MAPYVPEEVDVFSIPHSRMKELVNAYVQMIKNTNFTNDLELRLLLESLLRTFEEFKYHEQIENQFIMRKLKNKLRQLSIKNSAVCNCHSDDTLSSMMHFIENGYRKKTEQDRINFGVQLKQALKEFTDSFLPHMKEEEEVFQPLLLQYFSYEELRDLRDKVIQQHIIKEKVQLKEQATSASTTTEGGLEPEAVADQKEKVDDLKKEDQQEKSCFISRLPPEIMIKIFSHLNPVELSRCAQVNHEWARLAVAPELWRTVCPVLWAQGNWAVEEDCLDDSDDDEEELSADSDEEYSSLDEEEREKCEIEPLDILTKSRREVQREGKILSGLVKAVLPKAGPGVKRLVLKHSKAITNGVLHKMLQLCPNLEVMDLSYTKITDQGLRCLGKFGIGSRLKKVKFSGCINVTDATLVRLAMAQHQSLKVSKGTPIQCPMKEAVEDSHVMLHSKPKINYNRREPRHDLKPKPQHDMLNTTSTLGDDNSSSVFDCEAEDLCCQNTGRGVCLDLIRAIDVDTGPRDCLCEAYYEECHQSIEGGCELKITTTCKKATKSYSAATSKKNSDRERNVKGCCRKVQHAGPENDDGPEFYWSEKSKEKNVFTYQNSCADDECINSMKDPDYDIDVAMLNEPYTQDSQLYDYSNKRYNETKEPCHKGCKDSAETQNHDFMAAIEECIPNALKRTKDVTFDEVDLEKAEFQLEQLNLSGCLQLSNVGLSALARIGSYPRLTQVDLSGCPRLSADGIAALCDVAPRLRTELYYCDNIVDGPLSDEAGGCRNLGCGSRYCCRFGQ